MARLITPVGPGSAQLPASPKGEWQSLEAGGGWLLGHQVLLRQGSEAPAWLAQRALLSAADRERWRVQQAIPTAPGELNDDTNPFELGLGERVSLNKGCYVGQETLAKLSTYDGVKQQLRRWSWTPQTGELPGEAPGEPPAALKPGTTLYAPDATGDGTSRAGVISSSLELEDGTWIGLALVRKQALQQPLLQAGDGPRPATLLLS
jgi:folate-binding protein YgfZ